MHSLPSQSSFHKFTMNLFTIKTLCSSQTLKNCCQKNCHSTKLASFIPCRFPLFLLVKRTVATINSLEELENQTEIQYGVLDNGSVQTFFKTSEDPLYTRMFLHMRDHKTAVKSTAEGVRKARTEKYAYITEKPYLEYYDQQEPCNTRLLSNLLQAKGYGIALQGNSPYTNDISVAILEVSGKQVIRMPRQYGLYFSCP